MRRREAARGPAKSRRRKGIRKGRKTSIARESTAELRAQINLRTRERDEALEQQAATADVLKIISRPTLELAMVLNALAETVTRLCRADYSTMYRRRDDKYHLVAAYGASEEVKEFVRTHPFVPDRGTLTGRVGLERRMVHIPDVLSDPEYTYHGLQKIAGYRSMLGVPLLRGDELIGIFDVHRTHVEPFTTKEIELATTFADQAVIAIENARLFDEVQARTRDLEESLQQQTATADVLKVISRSTFDLHAVLQTLVESAARLCDADMAQITRQRDGVFFRAEAYGLSDQYLEYARTVPIAADRGSVIGRALLEGTAIHVPDVLADPEYTFTEGQRLAHFRAALAVPMLRQGAPIGVIVISRKEARPFTQKQIELATTFADQAVIAIENVRLFDEVRTRTRELTEALTYQTGSANILKVIASSPTDVKPVLTTIVESACVICEAEEAHLGLRDGDELVFQVHHGSFPVVWKRRPINRLWVTGRAAVDRRPVHVHDLLSPEGDEFPDGRELARRDGSRTLLAVPLLREGECIGVIALRRMEVRPFSDKHIELLRTFADQAVIAIGNVRLFDEVQAKTRDLEESLQQQTATADVLKVISRSAFDLQIVLDTLVESAARLCEADLANLWRPSGPVYRLAAVYEAVSSQQADYLRGLSLQADRGTCLGRTLLARDVIQIEDIHADPDYAVERSKLAGHRTHLGVPLLREGAPIGVIVLVRLKRQTFSVKQIELVKTFADQAVIAIENVRLFDEVQARTRELTQSLEELRTTQDRLVQTQKLALLGQLTAGIAHEIKNPLNFVNNFSGISAELIDELRDTLRGVSLDDKARAEIEELADTLKGNFDKVVHHGRRADAIVKNMLQHSREGSGEHRMIDINTLVEESLNLAWHGARAETQGFEIKLRQSFDPSAGGADVFPQDIRRALLNLIANGFYATKRKAEANDGDYEQTLTASTKNLGDHVEIRIRDNGTGIAADVKEKMFEPFFTTKPTGEGTGLGLSISHDIIVKQHAGTIEVDTQPGVFTEIRIILPRTPAFV